MRRFILLLMLLTLPWKAFASTIDIVWHEAGSMAQFIEHEMEHENGIPHHHHEKDNFVHYDDSNESKNHLNDHVHLSHLSVYEIGLSANSLSRFFVFPSSQNKAAVSSSLFPSSTFLEGLRRPPRVHG